jgi:hypothetical protein
VNWKDVEQAAPTGLKLLGGALAMTGVGAPIGALVGGLGAIVGHLIGAPPTPENVAAAMADPNLQLKLLEMQESNKGDLQKMLLTRDMAEMADETQQQAAVLADKQSARARDTALITAGKTNVRSDLMLTGAYLSVGLIVLSLCVAHIDPGSAIFALLLMLATKFAGNIGTAFDFEFGSSRGSVDKTAALANQAADASAQAAKVAAAVVDAAK